MDVVLLESIKNLGKPGDVVKVKNGYARNFLIPRGVALRASKENIAVFEEKKAEIEKRNAEKHNEAEALAKKLNGTSITIIRQAAEDGRLYGSVTVREIAESLKGQQKQEVESSAIDLLTPIKAVGLYKVRLSLYAGVTAEIGISVARSESEVESLLAKEIAAAEAAKKAAIEASAEGTKRAAARKKAEETEATEEAPSEE